MSKWLVATAALALGCHPREEAARPSPTPGSVPEIASATEEDFHDLVFNVEKVATAGDHSQEITAVGVHKGQPVRFQAVLSPTWEEGHLADRATYRGMVTIRSLGTESDALVKVIDGLYRAKVNATTMARAVPFGAISLKGNPSRLAAGEVDIKLFFESKSEARYAELYLNIDLPKNRVELREKDEEYRAPVVRALSLGPE